VSAGIGGALDIGRLARMALFGGLRLFGKLLHHLGLAELVIRLRRRSPRVLVYHSCAAREMAFTEPLGCYLPVAAFGRHVETIARYYNTATVTDLETGNLPDRPVLITFDDGHQSIYNDAMPLMRRYGMVATVYLVTAVIGNDVLMWPHEVCWFLRSFKESTLSTLTSHHPSLPRDVTPFGAVNFLSEHSSPVAIEAILHELRRRHDIDAATFAHEAGLYLSWEQVASLQGAGFEFGSHTHRHPNCARLTLIEFQREIARSREEIVSHLSTPTSFAFPFGAWSEIALAALPDLGFKSALLLGESNRQPLDLLEVGRVGTEARTEAEFFADVEIVAPLRKLFRRLVHRAD
jgi:peptidoglycan/xylan/chitin deacetylase (PgdA/CDA1 family)